MNRRNFIKNVLATGLVSMSGLWLIVPPSKSNRAEGSLLRPPGALPNKAEFLSRCIRCLRCVDACPNHAIIPLGDSYGREHLFSPAIKARRQACMLCNKIEGKYLKCTEACPTGALQIVRKDPEEIQKKVAMGTAEIDMALCYSYNNWSCGACYRACPFPGRAMTLGLWERPEVHAEACIGCGLCERACIRYPQAIRVKASVV